MTLSTSSYSYPNMALDRASSTASDALAERDFPHINWKFSGDIDTTPLRLLATWAGDRDTWTNSWEGDGATASPSPVATEQEAFNYLNMRMLKQYTNMNHHSPAPTLHLVAELINATRRYLESTHLGMHNQYVSHEGGYHDWAANALDKWAGPIKGCLDMAGLYNGRLARKEGERPENVPWYKPVPPLDPLPKRWEDLCNLRDMLTGLSTYLVTAKQALIPQLAEIERMMCTGQMWAPKMVDVYSPVENRRPNGFIKIQDESGYAADLFVRANADFQNDVRLGNRIGSSTQVQWMPYRLPDGRYQVAPELHYVAMPAAAWHTVARVAAVLLPHPGRQSDIKTILDKPRWHSDGPWLEKEMEAFFQSRPGTDPVRLLVDDARHMRLLDGLMDSDPGSCELSSPPPALLQNDETPEEANAKAREWQEQQRMDVDVSLHEIDEISFLAGRIHEGLEPHV